jgi:surface protein
MPEISRIIHYNENNEIIILEIKPEDELNDKEKFLHFDFDDENAENELSTYINKEIYILPYRENNKKEYPTGKIQNKENDNIILHNCKDIELDKETNLFPFPICLLENYNVIGLNKSETQGVYLKKILEEFNKKVKKSREEEIEVRKEKENNNIMNEKKGGMPVNEKVDILSMKNNEQNIMILNINVNINDINNEVYFFDNYKYKNTEATKREKGFLKEIEAFKEKIKIKLIKPNNNEEKLAYSNKFIPNEEGAYIIEIEIPELIKDCSYMFYGCTNITDIDLSTFDFQSTTNMNDMFNYCINVKEIKFSQFEIKNVINTSYMFNYCKNLLAIDLSKINTENVVSMAGMFQHCEKLKKLDLSNFDIKNNTQLSCMFNDCYELEEIIFSQNFDTKNVVFMPWMFYGCENLRNLDLTSFKFDKNVIRDMSQMFIGCDKLEEIKVNEQNKKFFISTNNEILAKFRT